MFRIRSAAFLIAVAVGCLHAPTVWGRDSAAVKPIAAVGFNCAEALRPPIAELVCDNPNLARADFSLAQVYYALRQQVGESGWPALRQEYLGFIGGIGPGCAVPRTGTLPSPADPMTVCVQREYENQRDNWLGRLTGPAAEEARRPADDQIALQRRLQELGYLPATANIDGIYGVGTRAAIVTWQQSRKLPATGFLAGC